MFWCSCVSFFFVLVLFLFCLFRFCLVVGCFWCWFLFCFCVFLFLFFVFCFLFFVLGGGFKGQVRWPEGPPHLAPFRPLTCFHPSDGVDGSCGSGYSFKTQHFLRLKETGPEPAQSDDDAPPRQIRLWSRRQTVLLPDGDGEYAPLRLAGVPDGKPGIAVPRLPPC